MITCKSCGKRLSELCFDSTKEFKNGKIYINHYTMCKKCIALKAKNLPVRNEEPINEIPDRPTLKSYSWVLRNLQKYGNCYIKHLSKVNISDLSNKLGCALKVRPTDKENKGYIIEKVK